MRRGDNLKISGVVHGGSSMRVKTIAHATVEIAKVLSGRKEANKRSNVTIPVLADTLCGMPLARQMRFEEIDEGANYRVGDGRLPANYQL